jgi:hypothetical protein
MDKNLSDRKFSAGNLIIKYKEIQAASARERTKY